jgi:hypothetical protein
MNYSIPKTNLNTGRQMIVADKSKLNFFAQANSSRFGIQNSAGALGYLGMAGDGDETTILAEQNTLGPKAANTGAVKTLSDVATVTGSFLSSLLGGKPAGTDTGYVAPPPAPDDTIAGLPKTLVIVAGLGVAGFVAWKMFKK